MLVACGVAGQGLFFFADGHRRRGQPDPGRSRAAAQAGEEDERGISASPARAAATRSMPARDFIIGGSLRDEDVALAGTERVSFGQDVSGSLAAGTMTALDSELDFGKGEWRIYRDGIKDRAGYARIESEIRHHNLANGSAYIFSRRSASTERPTASASSIPARRSRPGVREPATAAQRPARRYETLGTDIAAGRPPDPAGAGGQPEDRRAR